MEGSNPKISFIPKGSLIREESFSNRRRPRSAMAVIAGIAFLSTVGAYGWLYYANGLLDQEVAKKTVEINNAQQNFKKAPEVAEARIFRARADLARELLNSHALASPILLFLSENTAEKIMYDKFAFKSSPEGPVLSLSGEAETYAVLAYQADVLRTKARQLSKFVVKDFSLTKFGTVTFSFEMTFTPEYLSYVRNLDSDKSDDGDDDIKTATSSVTSSIKKTTVIEDKKPISTNSTKVATSTGVVKTQVASTTSTSSSSKLDGGNKTQARNIVATTTPVKTTAKRSKLMELWSKFKFW